MLWKEKNSNAIMYVLESDRQVEQGLDCLCMLY